MSATRKIKGWVTGHADGRVEYIRIAGTARISLWETKDGINRPVPATLVVHEGELVFTEEEHEAEFQRRAAGMLRELDDACGFAPIHFEIAERHGITL
jgi:acylphosphatase